MKVKKVKNTKSTHIALVLDKSGSMLRWSKEAIVGFNSQIDVIQKNAQMGGETTLTIVEFNGGVEVLARAVCASAAKKITNKTYQPEGTTAMRDGVFKAIKILEKLDNRGPETAFLVVVISDGEENSSNTITAEALAEKISGLQNSNRWTFAYIGANQDLSKVQKTYELYTNNVMSYNTDSSGYKYLYTTSTNSLSNFMSLRENGTLSTDNYFAPSKNS